MYLINVLLVNLNDSVMRKVERIDKLNENAYVAICLLLSDDIYVFHKSGDQYRMGVKRLIIFFLNAGLSSP